MIQEKSTRIEIVDACKGQTGSNRAYVVSVVILAAILSLMVVLVGGSAKAAPCNPERNPDCEYPEEPPEEPPPPPGTYDPLPGGFSWRMLPRYPGSNEWGVTDFSRFSRWHTPDYVQANGVENAFNVQFNGCASQADRDLANQGKDTNFTYSWSFPGSADPPLVVRDCTVGRRYMQEGSYDVTLTIKNAAGATLGTFEPPVTPTVTVKDKLIVAIGDSYGAGEGSPDVARTYDWRGFVATGEKWGDRQCHRSSYAGSAQAARQLEYEDPHSSVTFVFLACSGATILRNGDRGVGLLGSYNGIEPEAGTPLPPQIDQVQNIVGNRRIDALIVTAGGNDVYFADIIKHCAESISCYDQYDTPWFSDFDFDYFNNAMAALGVEDGTYDILADEISTRLNVENVYITEYPSSLTDEDGKLCDGDENLQTDPLLWGITENETRWISDIFVTPLNKAINDAVNLQKAKGRSWNFVGGISNPFLKHGFCSKYNWVRTSSEAAYIQGPLWNMYEPVSWVYGRLKTEGKVHPNPDGYAVYKEHLLNAIRGTISPGPTFVASEPEYTPGRVVVRVTATDPSGIKSESVSVDATGGCQVEGVTCTTTRPDGQSLEWTIEVTKEGEGAHTFDFAATDADEQASSFVHEVEFLPPPPPIIHGPTDNSYDTDGSLTFSGAAEAGSKISLFEEGKQEPVGSATANASNAWSITLTGVGNGSHTYTAKATNILGLTSVASEPVRVGVDTQAPKVSSTTPAATAKGVAPGANITATFSEAMDPKTLVTTPTDPANPNVGTSTTFKLMKAGTTTTIGAVVSYDSTTKKATLNPTTNLRLGTKYKAAVTTEAKDLAGNQLDQDQDPSNGLQQMGWSFTIKN